MSDQHTTADHAGPFMLAAGPSGESLWECQTCGDRLPSESDGTARFRAWAGFGEQRQGEQQ